MRDLSSSTNGPSVMRCNIDYEKLKLQDFFNWGINAFSTRYEPNNNRFAITYSKGNENKSEDVTMYINDNKIMDKLRFRKHVVVSTINNDSIELTSYDKEIESGYTLLGSDADILRNIVSNGIWNSETCDGLPEYTFVYDNRKYGIEVFSSQIHITDMSGKSKGEIVCTGEEFNTLKMIVDKAKGYRSSKIAEAEFALISSNSKLVLGKEIADFPKIPISTTENRGDGYVWDDIVYDDIQIKVVKNTDDGSQPILEMVTTSNNYETPRGIRVGDNIEELKEAYPIYLKKDYHGDWGEYYLYDPDDDIGFCKIMFYLKNDVITKISVFNGIDG